MKSGTVVIITLGLHKGQEGSIARQTKKLESEGKYAVKIGKKTLHFPKGVVREIQN